MTLHSAAVRGSSNVPYNVVIVASFRRMFIPKANNSAGF
jgi:hypothetical protein